ncbi:MAG: type II toxin-antitoxin system HicB family antitoxin [Phycisphaerae bacterium]
MRYAVIIEPADDGSYSCYVPDLPGCISCGDTAEEATRLIREAIDLHIEAMRETGEPVPPPRSQVTHVDAA